MRMVHLLAFGLALAGCAGTSYVQSAKNITQQSGGDVDALLARNAALGERAGKLSGGAPAAIIDRLGANKTVLDGLKSDLTGAPTKIEQAEKDKKRDEAKATFETQKTARDKGLPAARAELDAIEQELAKLEAAKPTMNMRAVQFQRKLPSGYNVLGNLDGIEAQLLAFIEDKNRAVDKTTWFDFDRLTFKTAIDQLDMERSKAQLQNIAEIMKAYPAVQLKVGGYTDNVGKAADNMKLSTARAKNVTQNLVDLGIAASRLVPEGYGMTNAKCPANDTEACRQQNRRIAVRVTAK